MAAPPEGLADGLEALHAAAPATRMATRTGIASWCFPIALPLPLPVTLDIGTSLVDAAGQPVHKGLVSDLTRKFNPGARMGKVGLGVPRDG